MDPLWFGFPVVAVLALLLGFLAHKWTSDRKIGDASARATRIVGDAERDAQTRHRTAELEAREIVLKARGEFDAEVRQREREIQQIEQRILNKDEQLARKLEDLERRLTDYTSKEKGLVDRERDLAGKEGRLSHAVEEQRRRLEAIAGLTAEEAKRQLLAQMEEEARREAALIGMRLEEQARETAREKAKEVLATTIQRSGSGLHRRDLGLGGGSALRRHEGPHHRARGPEHPSPGDAHRRGPHRGRHAGSRADLGL